MIRESAYSAARLSAYVRGNGAQVSEITRLCESETTFETPLIDSKECEGCYTAFVRPEPHETFGSSGFKLPAALKRKDSLARVDFGAQTLLFKLGIEVWVLCNDSKGAAFLLGKCVQKLLCYQEKL